MPDVRVAMLPLISTCTRACRTAERSESRLMP